MTAKPFSQACENNKDHILEALKREFRPFRRVLEIGSGTGQHAVHFARHMSWLQWQTADLEENHPGITAWIADSGLHNLQHPLALDVRGEWPVYTYDAVFTANTFHIMSWSEVLACLDGVRDVLRIPASFVVYGPFRVAGDFTSASNAAFDAELRKADPDRGIRDIEAVQRECGQRGLLLHADFAMPANNRLLVFRREETRDD